MASAEVIAPVKASLTLCVLLLIAGCAAGTNVGRPASGALVRGKITYQNVVAKYGTPWAKGSIVVNEHSIDTITYVYASLIDEVHVPGINPARGLNLWFENNVLMRIAQDISIQGWPPFFSLESNFAAQGNPP